MILDQFDHADLYRNLSPRIAQAFDYLKNLDITTLQDGRNDIDGDNLFAMLNRYTTQPAAERTIWEAHRQYLDIQYMVSGEEHVGYQPLEESPPVTTAYNAEDDVVLFAGEGNPLRLTPGMFALFYPQDIHQPAVAIDQPQDVVKVVMKVKV